MVPSQSVDTSSNSMYMLPRSPTSRQGTTSEMMMMMPPMVGVPVFFICPSRPRLRTVSPICISCRRLMMRRPMTVDMNSDSRAAATERTVM